MPSLRELRDKYPQYSDMSDAQFADAFYSKFYSDMPREKFDQSIQFHAPQMHEPPAPEKPLAWSDVPGKMVENAPGSALQFGKDLVQPFLDPVGTAQNLGNLAVGVLQKLGLNPQGPFGMGSGAEDKTKYADAVGKFLMDRYGSIEGIKHTLATDPVGMASDLSLVLTGGGAAAAKAPGMIGRAGEMASTAGRAIDPLVGVGKVIAPVAKGAGIAAAEVLGAIGSHTGGAPLRIGAEAGHAGGDPSRIFLENVRGTAPSREAADAARTGLMHIVQQRGSGHRAEMAKLGLDTKVLDFNKIDDAITKATEVKRYKGQDLSPSTSAVRKEMTQAVQEWKLLNPKEFHTAEGLDALKKKLGDIYKSTEHGTPERVVAREIYNSVRQTIIDQVPQYEKVMKAWENATETIEEMNKALGLNPNASIDTSLRKLQSSLRDNVNTSYGHRRELAKVLVQAGAPHLLERLAGQALQPWFPRGLGRLAASLGAEVVALTGGHAAGGLMGSAAIGLPMLAASSPRVLGEMAHGAGVASRYAEQYGVPAMRAEYQAGRMGSQLNPREMVKQDAKAALRDDPTRRFTPQEIRTLREVARGAAPVDTVLSVKRLLERRFAGPDAAYGGPL